MNNNQFVLKLYGFATVFLLFGLFIGYKLFHIQFVDGEKYRQLAEDNTLKYSTVNPKEEIYIHLTAVCLLHLQ